MKENNFNESFKKVDTPLNREAFLKNFSKITELIFASENIQERAGIYTKVMKNARAVGYEDETEQALQETAFERGEPELWELPESFDNLKKTAPFPLNSLPLLLRDYLKAVADYVQVVPEMAVLPLLSVLSLCVQGKAVIKHTGNDYGFSLYT